MYKAVRFYNLRKPRLSIKSVARKIPFSDSFNRSTRFDDVTTYHEEFCLELTAFEQGGNTVKSKSGVTCDFGVNGLIRRLNSLFHRL